ncbi:ECF transporter S component [Aeromonas veronii]|uniref:ECF transporter S component n=1 Tax=Aeromonas veronii TaxID=654 RepID=UPI002441FF5E|nr:ECF transporter S component [Aeromonas veronii]
MAPCWRGAFEVIALGGTLDPECEHLHLSISDKQGLMRGGHVLPGCRVRTTLELVVGELEAYRFGRAPCPQSGYEELLITPQNLVRITMSVSKLSSYNLAFMVICIAINMVAGQAASMLKLPIFLDSIGTVLCAILAGPWMAVATGLLTNLLWGLLTGPIATAFAPVAMMIGLSAGLLARAGWFNNLPKVVVSSVVITLALTLVAIPIRSYLFGGATGSGADFVVAYLHAMGSDLQESVAVTVLGTNLLDKLLTVLIAWGLVRRLPQRTLRHFPQMAAVR